MMIKGPMRASMDDFDSIVELADECFPRDRDSGGMLARWPHCYIPRPEKIRNCLIMKDGPKVVSLVEYVDQTLRVEGSDLKVAGITAVSTWPSYRGRSLMTRLLDYCISLMREEGYAFSDLGGDRQRYGRFGWENAGRQWSFTITHRSFQASGVMTPYEIGLYDARSEEVDAIMAIHEKEAMGVKRSRELYEMLLGRKGKQVWLAKKGGGITAYAITESRGHAQQPILEFGGNADGVRSILSHLIANGNEVLHLVSPWSHPLNGVFYSLSADWLVEPKRMVKLIDLGRTLRGFAHQLGEGYRELGLQGSRTVILAVEGVEQRIEIEFSPEGAVVKKSTDLSNAFTLSDRQMVRLLLGLGTPSSEFSLPPNARFLKGLLPLDFYIWENEAV
jgi:GNAT superfamily N-acetyltransferase